VNFAASAWLHFANPGLSDFGVFSVELVLSEESAARGNALTRTEVAEGSLIRDLSSLLATTSSAG